ncbi:MAG: hypothetical protein HC933_12225 [Pleurocapsa sp. SU_196_0]|nr:hypothetical protein [Pleurocapsa sp. SU_196_0]
MNDERALSEIARMTDATHLVTDQDTALRHASDDVPDTQPARRENDVEPLADTERAPKTVSESDALDIGVEIDPNLEVPPTLRSDTLSDDEPTRMYTAQEMRDLRNADRKIGIQDTVDALENAVGADKLEHFQRLPIHERNAILQTQNALLNRSFTADDTDIGRMPPPPLHFFRDPISATAGFSNGSGNSLNTMHPWNIAFSGPVDAPDHTGSGATVAHEFGHTDQLRRIANPERFIDAPHGRLMTESRRDLATKPIEEIDFKNSPHEVDARKWGHEFNEALDRNRVQRSLEEQIPDTQRAPQPEETLGADTSNLGEIKSSALFMDARGELEMPTDHRLESPTLGNAAPTGDAALTDADPEIAGPLTRRYTPVDEEALYHEDRQKGLESVAEAMLTGHGDQIQRFGRLSPNEQLEVLQAQSQLTHTHFSAEHVDSDGATVPSTTWMDTPNIFVLGHAVIPQNQVEINRSSPFNFDYTMKTDEGSGGTTTHENAHILQGRRARNPGGSFTRHLENSWPMKMLKATFEETRLKITRNTRTKSVNAMLVSGQRSIMMPYDAFGQTRTRQTSALGFA